jgi:hypothetical protein
MARRKKTDEPDLEQGYIPGTEPETHKDIDQAAKVYYKAMTERKELSEEEDQAKDNLIDKMKEHRLQYYETKDGKVVTLTETSNLKVKPKKVKHPTDDNESSNGEA